MITRFAQGYFLKKVDLYTGIGLNYHASRFTDGLAQLIEEIVDARLQQELMMDALNVGFLQLHILLVSTVYAEIFTVCIFRGYPIDQDFRV